MKKRKLARTVVFLTMFPFFYGCAANYSLEPQDDFAVFNPTTYEIVHVCYKEERLPSPKFGEPDVGPFGRVGAGKLMEICISNLQKEKFQLTDNNVIDESPSWSPDGNSIVFCSEMNADSGLHVYSMDRTGSNLQQLTQIPGGYHNPQWSPDGKMIAVFDSLSGNLNLILESGSVSELITDIGVYGNFSWSPDSTEIVFSGYDHGTSKIYIINIYSGAIRKISDSENDYYQPLWIPNSEIVIYKSDREIVIYNSSLDEKVNSITSVRKDGYVGLIFLGMGSNQLGYYGPYDVGMPEQKVYIVNTNGILIDEFDLNNLFDQRSLSWSFDGKYLLFLTLEDWNEDGYFETKIKVMDLETKESWNITQ